MWSRCGAVVALTAGMLALGAPAAFASDPVDLQGAYVLDTVGAITGDEARVTAAIEELYASTRIQLFVVYVDSFTGTTDGDWANQTAIDNGLGESDILLAIATVDRNFEVSIDDAFTLSDAQLTTVETDFLIPELREDNWADAAIAAAQGYEAEATGAVDPATPTTPTAETDSGISPIVPIIGGVAVVGVGALVVTLVRRRNRSVAPSAQPSQLTQKQLDQRAGTLLVQLDDSLKTSEQELGFAVAQFGDATTKDFTVTLASAKAKVSQAFTLKQQLDDAQPDSDIDKREWTTQIIQLCEAADAELDAQADAFDALRELEKNAPAALVSAREAIAAASTRPAAAEAALAALSSKYSAAAVRPVAENPAQARKLLEFAAVSADAAQTAIAGGKPGDAAIAVRSTEQALGQAGQLFDAITTLGTDLDAAAGSLAAAVADTEQDIAAAKALQPEANLNSAVAAAESALAAARAAATDPLASLAQVGTANAALEQVFTGVRDTQQLQQRASAQLDAAIAAARAQITSTAQFITTRRGGIGESARTRVSEADRHLSQAVALATSDPVAALAEAQQANSLAANAFDLARNDVQSYESQQSVARQPSSSAPYRGSDGATLGGLLGELFGGGGGGGGWSPRPSSGSRGGGFSGGASRSSRSGSFGGSSRSSSRSSGGRSSRGGRF